MVEPVGLNQQMLEVRAMTDANGFSADHARIWEMLVLIRAQVLEATDAYKKGEPIDDHAYFALALRARPRHRCAVPGKMKKNWERAIQVQYHSGRIG